MGHDKSRPLVAILVPPAHFVSPKGDLSLRRDSDSEIDTVYMKYWGTCKYEPSSTCTHLSVAEALAAVVLELLHLLYRCYPNVKQHLYMSLSQPEHVTLPLVWGGGGLENRHATTKLSRYWWLHVNHVPRSSDKIYWRVSDGDATSNWCGRLSSKIRTCCLTDDITL